MTDEIELQRTADLLNLVFAHSAPLTVPSLRWYYDENPAGHAAVGRVEEGNRRLGNYALVPNLYRSVTGEERVLGVGVDLAVDPVARGSGIFRRTVEDSYRRGIEQHFDGILGVANANSAPRMVETLGWRSLPSLPVTLVAAVGRASEFVSMDVSALTIDVIDELAEGAFPRSSTHGFAPVWTPELLRWRLQRPGHHYSLHLSDDLVVVSTRTHVAKVPFGVILGVLARRPCEAVRVGRVAAAIGKHHKAPFVIHWGRTPLLRLRGLPLPQKFMPSPLSLVLHPFVEDFATDEFDLGEFGFLDFDAY